MTRLETLPLPLQAAVKRQLAKENAKAHAAVEAERRAKVPGISGAECEMVPRLIQPVLDVRRDPLTIVFPGMLLLSANAVIKNPRKYAAAAKDLAKVALTQAAFREAENPRLWRFESRVDIFFTQYAPRKNRIDGENLWTKPLLDGLTRRGLGIIDDDGWEHVRFVARASEAGDPQVVVLIVPVEVGG